MQSSLRRKNRIAGGNQMKEYLDMWKHYADFNSCTNLKGYWMAFLFNAIIGVVLSVLAQNISFFALIMNLYTLAALIPGLAISVRRLKDGGKHWANIFWGFLPVVGTIILIVMLCAPSQTQQANA